MNWEAIGAIGEILGATAVVVSLVYLAIQIRSNTRATKSAVVARLREEFNRGHDTTLNNPDHAGLLVKLRSPSVELSIEDEIRAFAWANRSTNMWRSAITADSLGQLTDDYYEAMRRDVEAIVTGLPGLIPYLLGRDPAMRSIDIFRPVFDGESVARNIKIFEVDS